MKKVRIAMIIEAWKPLWGGGQEVAFQLAKHIGASRDYEVDLYGMGLKGTPKNEKYKEFNLIKVGKGLSWSFSSRIRWLFSVYKEIKNTNSRKKYDLIYAHANLPGIPAKLLSKKLKVPVVYHVHGSGIKAIKQMYGNSLSAKIIASIENYVQCKIKYDLEFTVDKDFLKRINVNKPVFIPNGVDIKKFDKVKIQKEKSFFKILFVGRLHPQKGLIYLIKAAEIIKETLREKNVKFVIVGEGEEEKRLKDEIKRRRLGEFFVFKGKKDGEELIKEYESSHIFVLPSLYEGFPLTLLEAWAAKLPVLVTDVGENPNVVKEGVNGWVAKSANPKDLASLIKKILNLDKKKMNFVGIRGYETVYKSFSWKKVSSSIKNKTNKFL